MCIPAVCCRKEASVMTLRSKYANMYIPSDFFNANSPWVDNLPLNRPFVLGQQCKFHVMHKEVSPLTAETAVLDPPDADHKYCAKVCEAVNWFALWNCSLKTSLEIKQKWSEKRDVL